MEGVFVLARQLVAIDPGHGGQDPGNVFEGRQEKDDNLAMAMAVGQRLEQNGVDVVYTRTTDVYDTPHQKAQMANRANADYLLSLHRNAAAKPDTATGVESLVFRENTPASDLAREINFELEKLGFENRGVKERPNLMILKNSKMPAVLVELGFINNRNDNEKFDQLFNEIADAIVNAFFNATGMEKDENTDGSEEEAEQRLYRVQVGAFRNTNTANKLLNELLEQGYPAFLIFDDGLYKVQVGAFAMLNNAVQMEQTLRQSGYNTFITT